MNAPSISTVLFFLLSTLKGAYHFKGCRLAQLKFDSANLRDVGKDAFADVKNNAKIILYTRSLKNNPFADGDEFPASLAEKKIITLDTHGNVYVRDSGIILADGTRVALPAKLVMIGLQSGEAYNMSSDLIVAFSNSSQFPLTNAWPGEYTDVFGNVSSIPDDFVVPPDPLAPPRQGGSGGSGMSDYERHGVSPREAVFEQGQSLSYEIDADFKRYIKLKYENDTLVRGVDYTIESGKIILSPEWLTRLGRGEHALYAEFASGDAELNVIIEK